MFWRLCLLGILAAIGQGAESPRATGLSVVSVFFSDYGGQFYYRVLDVKLDGSDSLVRLIRVVPRNLLCPGWIVQATEERVRDTSPAELIKSNNPCAVKPSALQNALKRYFRTEGVFESVSFGIAADCGSSAVSLGLPIGQKVNLQRMKRGRPELARLWSLSSEVEESVFGKTDRFHDISEKADLDLQLAGEKLVPELTSGKYDTGLASAFRGNVGDWSSPSFRTLLADYRGPITLTEAEADVTPQLLESQKYRFSYFVAPTYPPLAKQAHIQGRVELQLVVEAETGQVRSASLISGHPLLNPPAIAAARQWIFAPNSLESDAVNVTLEFTFRCP